MTDFGFRVINSNNFLQVDSNYQNYSLLVKGSSVTVESNMFIISGVGFFSVNLTAYPETSDPSNFLVFFRLTASDKWLQAWVAPGSISGLVYGNSGMEGGIGVTVEWAVYVKKMTNAAGFGLKVYKADGTIVLNTLDKILTVENVLNLHPWSGNSSPTKLVSHGGSSAPFVCPIIGTLYFSYIDIGQWYTWEWCFRCPNNTQIEVGAVKSNFIGGGAGGTQPMGIDKPFATLPNNLYTLTPITFKSY